MRIEANSLLFRAIAALHRIRGLTGLGARADLAADRPCDRSSSVVVSRSLSSTRRYINCGHRWSRSREPPQRVAAVATQRSGVAADISLLACGFGIPARIGSVAAVLPRDRAHWCAAVDPRTREPAAEVGIPGHQSEPTAIPRCAAQLPVGALPLRRCLFSPRIKNARTARLPNSPLRRHPRRSRYFRRGTPIYGLFESGQDSESPAGTGGPRPQATPRLGVATELSKLNTEKD